MNSFKTVAITGSTGMIGLALTNYLISNGITVIMFIREESKKTNLIPNSPLIKVVKCNLENLKTFQLNLQCDCFFHLGWEQTIGKGRMDTDIQLKNISYTLDAVRLAKKMGAKKFVGVGSQAEYGIHSNKLSIDSHCNPISAYGIAKYSAGKLSKILSDQLGLEFNWIRVLSVYGENDNPNTLISYLKNCLKSNISPNLTKCEQVWDYINDIDAAKIIYIIAKNGLNGITYPLGSGIGRPLKFYVEQIKNDLNPSIKINYGAIEYSKDQIMYLVADMSYLEELTKDE